MRCSAAPTLDHPPLMRERVSATEAQEPKGAPSAGRQPNSPAAGPPLSPPGWPWAEGTPRARKQGAARPPPAVTGADSLSLSTWTATPRRRGSARPHAQPSAAGGSAGASAPASHWGGCQPGLVLRAPLAHTGPAARVTERSLVCLGPHTLAPPGHTARSQACCPSLCRCKSGRL